MRGVQRDRATSKTPSQTACVGQVCVGVPTSTKDEKPPRHPPHPPHLKQTPTSPTSNRHPPQTACVGTGNTVWVSQDPLCGCPGIPGIPPTVGVGVGIGIGIEANTNGVAYSDRRGKRQYRSGRSMLRPDSRASAADPRRRKRQSRLPSLWIPTFAGMTSVLSPATAVRNFFPE